MQAGPQPAAQMFKRAQKFFAQARTMAFAPIDISSILFFRIAFGLLMAWHVWTFFTEHPLVAYFLEPRLLFKYYGFEWVHPWPRNGLFVHKVATAVFPSLIAAGVLYRITTT